MKNVLRLVFGGLGVLLLAALITAGAVYQGWISLPGFIVGIVANVRGLDATQNAALQRLAKVYQVAKTAPEAPLIDQAIGLAKNAPSDEEWLAFATAAWPQISDGTKERIRDCLAIEKADFETIDRLVTTRLVSAEDPGKVRQGAVEQAALAALDAKYGFTALLAQLSRGAP